MTTSGGVWSALWLTARSLFWTFAFPGFFAGYLPWRFFGLNQIQLDLSSPLHIVGVIGMAVGIGLLALCIFEFARSGRGTLSPADPPKHLVVRGLYRYVRNPMYLAVTTIVLSEVLLTWSSALLTYWVIWFAAVNLFVRGYEEPYLRRQFGDSYEAYTREVGRWIPTFRSRTVPR